MQRRGFTLVELSIVLVIIGLLIGGILVAQSMIETAKTLMLIRKISQYEIAVNNFKTTYNSYPGDSKNFSPPGDGDGNIGSPTSGTGNASVGLENINAWNHLVASGFYPEGINKTYSTNIAGGIVVGTNLPLVDKNIGVDLFTVSLSDIISVGGSNTNFNDWKSPYALFFSSFIDGNGNNIPAPVALDSYGTLSWIVYIAIDTKIDDGVTTTGILRSFGDPCYGRGFCIRVPEFYSCSTGMTCTAIYNLQTN